MKWVVVILLFVATLSFSEATVLPAGTVITLPGGTSKTLTSDEFLLERPDMEAAVKAIKDTAIDAKTIGDLKTLSDGQQRTIDNATTWKRIDALLGFFAGILADEGARKVLGK
jgi:hypothetical protein